VDVSQPGLIVPLLPECYLPLGDAEPCYLGLPELATTTLCGAPTLYYDGNGSTLAADADAHACYGGSHSLASPAHGFASTKRGREASFDEDSASTATAASGSSQGDAASSSSTSGDADSLGAASLSLVLTTPPQHQQHVLHQQQLTKKQRLAAPVAEQEQELDSFPFCGFEADPAAVAAVLSGGQPLGDPFASPGACCF
jgi:hypothetical protein